MPHLYIYNANNPPEGTIAKRRSNAALVDHMQAVMVQGELYGDLDGLERLLSEYVCYRQAEPAKAHTISHMIMDRVKTLNLIPEERLSHEMMDEAITRNSREALPPQRHLHTEGHAHIRARAARGRQGGAYLRHHAVRTGPGSLRAIISGVINRASPGLNGDLDETVESTPWPLQRLGGTGHFPRGRHEHRDQASA